MEKLTVILLLINLPIWALANQAIPGGTIQISISDIQNEGGIMMVALFTPDDEFLEVPTYAREIPVNAESEIMVELMDIPAGTYAVSIYHDLNSNGELDTNIFGIPKEPVGFSNDYFPKFGPPKYKNAAIQFDKSEMRITINLKSY